MDYQALFWFYGHPVVYVMFFPFVGMVGEIIATFSARRFFGYSAFIVALLVFSGLSMTVWAHHMFTFGVLSNKYFALTSTALIVPAGIEYFDFLATIWRGKLRFTTAFLFALGFLVQFLIGGLTGIILASPPLDYGLNMSYFVVAHFHYTIFAGSAFGLFGGIYYWFPKITGVMLRERLGKLHFVADGDRREPDVLPDVLPRRRGHGPPDRPLSGLQRLAGTEHRLDGRLVRDRGLGARVHRQRRRLPARSSPGGRGPVGGAYARVGDELAAAAAQLRRAAADPLLRPAAGPARGRGCGAPRRLEGASADAGGGRE